MQYSKNIQTQKQKIQKYGRRVPGVNANKAIEKQGKRCQFFFELFGIIRTDYELHHIHGRKNARHKHDPANLILLSREVHHAYHHIGHYEYQGVKMYAEDMKAWFINHNAKLYGKEAVERCK